MNIINEIKHDQLGDIFCVADENGNPLEWAKNEKVKLFSDKYSNIKISFNLFCFNKDFKFDDEFDDIAIDVERKIVYYYEIFLKDKNEIENVYYEWYRKNIKKDIDNEKMNESVNIKEVRVFTNGYAVIIETSYNDELLAIEKVIFEDGDYDISMQMESDIEVVEMDYEG